MRGFRSPHPGGLMRAVRLCGSIGRFLPDDIDYPIDFDAQEG
jgi:hypothetical protein